MHSLNNNKIIKTLAGLLVAASLSACAGVTPSVQVGVLHTTQPTTSIDTANNTATATNWLVGGSLTASFPQPASSSNLAPV